MNKKFIYAEKVLSAFILFVVSLIINKFLFSLILIDKKNNQDKQLKFL